MKPFVSIVTSDKGWILERLASALTARLDYVFYSDYADPQALINYYMTYSCWKQRVSPLQVGYFAHLEPIEPTRTLFFNNAREMDFCICHSSLYENILRRKGVQNVRAINPGIDEHFKPRLQIGVVGRTYHTGRKGEKLIAQLMDIDWIDWHFTGSGWPGQALNLADDEMPDFYRKMDYILVPALYEGGPMCVAEAIACGTPVIAPPIGWVPEFPHIEYKTGDAASLRTTLECLYKEKAELAGNAARISWDAWAEGHDRVFRSLAKKQGLEFLPRLSLPPAAQPLAALVMHGAEGSSRGGPSVRVPRTAKLLEHWSGRQTLLLRAGEAARLEKVSLAHVFNLWDPRTCLKRIVGAWKNNTPVVVSSIFLDLREKDAYEEVKAIFATSYSESDLHTRLERLRLATSHRLSNKNEIREAFPGHFDIIRDILNKTSHVIFLSEHEKHLFEKAGFTASSWSIIPNPVDSRLFANANPNLFAERYGIADYVLCVGRLEARKNQLMLVHALRNTDIPLVIVGHAGEKDYADLVRAHSHCRTMFIERLEPNSPMLASAYAGARIFCLASWSEGAPLAAMEAAAAGCSMVLSDRSSEREYYGDFALYCNPADPASIREKVLDLWNNPLPPMRKKALQKHVEEFCSWDRHIESTLSAYNRVLENRHEPSARRDLFFYIDMTASLAGKTAWEEAARERGFLIALSQCAGAVPVFWDAETQLFFPLPITFCNADFTQPDKSGYENIIEHARTFGPVDFKPDSFLIAAGRVWENRSEYVRSLRGVVFARKLSLFTFAGGILPLLAPQWSPYGKDRQFLKNFKAIMEVSACILAGSDEEISEILKAAVDCGSATLPALAIYPCELTADRHASQRQALDKMIAQLEGREFVLYAGPISINSNHTLLYRIWQKILREHGIEKTPHLIFAGRIAYGTNDFLDMLSRDQLAKKRIHILADASPTDLNWLFRYSAFSVFPAFGRDQAWPVLESLRHKKAVIASNECVISHDYAIYVDMLDPDDFVAWHRKISDYIFEPNSLAQKEKEISSFTAPSCGEAGLKLMQFAADSYFPPPEYPLAICGYPISASPEGAILPYLGKGWANPEKEGVWSSGAFANLFFRACIKADRGALVITCSGFAPEESGDTETEIFVNGKLSLILVAGKNLARNVVYLPVSNKSPMEFDSYHVEFVILNPKRPNDYNHANPDRRLLGLRLKEIMIEEAAFLDAVDKDINQGLDSLIEDGAAICRSVIATRPDIAARIEQKGEIAPLEFLFWALRYGVEENPILNRRKDKLFSGIEMLHKGEPDFPHIPGYSSLIHSLWLTRDDLHYLNPESDQPQIIKWFFEFGIDEYNLTGIPTLQLTL